MWFLGYRFSQGILLLHTIIEKKIYSWIQTDSFNKIIVIDSPIGISVKVYKLSLKIVFLWHSGRALR